MRSKVGQVAVVLLSMIGVVTMSGCSGSTRGAAASAGAVADTAPTVASACAALTEPASLAFNAPTDLAAGEITLEQSTAQLEEASRLFGEIEAPAGPLQDAISALVDYLDTAQPEADGQPFDPTSTEYGKLESHIIQACDAAGEEFIVNGHGG